MRLAVGGGARTLLASALFATAWLKLRGNPVGADIAAALLELCAGVLVAAPVRPRAGVLALLALLGCGSVAVALVRFFAPLSCRCLGASMTWRPWQHLTTALLLLACVALCWLVRGDEVAA